MSAARYAVGIAALVVALVPVAVGSRVLCRRLLPRFQGPPAWLSTAVVGLTIVILASEALGTFGAFTLLPLVVTLAASGSLAWWIGRRATSAPETTEGPEVGPAPAADRTGPWGTYAAIVAVGVVAAEWSIRTVDALRFGMLGTDSIWYHLPVAARFAVTGRTWDLHYLDVVAAPGSTTNSLTAFYPGASELLHGLGMVFLKGDLFSPLLNLLFVALALLAGWCVGRPYGLAPVTLIGTAFLLATPALALLNAGSAMNDVVGLALILAATAILVTATSELGGRLSWAALAIAASAAGLAFGTKYTFIAPVGALGVGVAVIGERGERVWRALLWFGAVALAGGYWYVRNLVAVGNPIPQLEIGIGPIQLPHLAWEGTESVAKYLFDLRVWRVYFLPGLGAALGPAWVLLIAASVAGMVLGAWLGPGRTIRMLAVVAGVSLAAFIVSPQVVGSVPGSPIYFAVNLRYALPALALGVLVLPLALDRWGRRAAYGVLIGYGSALLITQLDAGTWHRSQRFSALPTGDARSFAISGAIGVGVILVAGAFLALRDRTGDPASPSRRVLQVIALALLIVGCAGGYVLAASTEIVDTTTLPSWQRSSDAPDISTMRGSRSSGRCCTIRSTAPTTPTTSSTSPSTRRRERQLR